MEEPYTGLMKHTEVFCEEKGAHPKPQKRNRNPKRKGGEGSEGVDGRREAYIALSVRSRNLKLSSSVLN